MSFSERAKLTALAIVHIFETSKPMGDYSAVAVLDDGAGVSYGISQFTHRSGSLEAVLRRYEKLAGDVHSFAKYLIWLQDRTPGNVRRISADAEFKRLLRIAGKTEAMQQAQREIAFELYLKPALDACEGSDFECPLSLAVIYDSINHGSFQAIRDRVTFAGPGNGSIKPEEFEREWITRYVRARHEWLNSKPRLVKTAYRTKFFLGQIALSNWDLNLPMNVHGYRLTEKDIQVNETFADLRDDEIDLEVPVLAARPAAETPESVTETAAAVSVSSDTISAAAPPTLSAVGGMTEVEVEAPAPTGFIAKLKMQAAAVFAFIGGGAGLKEWFGVQLSAETVDLLKVLIPTVLGLGFLGFLVWYIAEKIVGFKTLKLKAEAATDPARHNLVINAK